MSDFPGLIDRGQGAPILFLHGFPDTPALWEELITALERSNRCIAPTLPGLGEDACNEAVDYSPQGKVKFIQSVLDYLNITEPVYLVVFDHGGPFGLHWAVANPDRVAGIVVLNSLFQPSYKWHFWARLWRARGVGELAMKVMNWPLFKFSVQLGSKHLPLEPMRAAYAALTPAFRENALKLYRATDPELFKEDHVKLLRLSKTVPVQVLWGSRDPYIEKEFAQQFGASNVRTFADSGHWVMLEQPVAIIEEISGFLAAN